MALADGRSRPSSSFHDKTTNEQSDQIIPHLPSQDQDRYSPNIGMVQHEPPEARKDKFDTVDYASGKLDVEDDANKNHMVGGGGGGATFIFKVIHNPKYVLLIY